jgi:hypothetical protein
VSGQEFTWTLGSVIFEANTYPFGEWDIERSGSSEWWIWSLSIACIVLVVGWVASMLWQRSYWMTRMAKGDLYHDIHDEHTHTHSARR